MSIVKMKRIALVGLDVKKDELISNLMDFGALEITDQTPKLAENLWQTATKVDEDPELISDIELKRDRAEIALSSIGKYGNLKSPMIRSRRRVTKNDLYKMENDEQALEEKVDFILELDNSINLANEKINKLNQDIASLSPWVNYDESIMETSTKYTDITFGVFPVASDVSAIQTELENEAPSSILKLVSSDETMHYATVVSLKKKTDDVMSLLKKQNFSPIVLGTELAEGSKALEIIENLEREKAATEKELQDLKEKISQNSSLNSGIENYFDMLSIKLDKEEIKTKLLKTERTFFIEGWVPEKSVPNISMILDEAGCFYEIRDPEEGEEVPVLLRNNSAVYPVEAITEMYSLPGYSGFDPTAIFSLFYVCFFGMMFSDAGYGLILAVGCFIALKKFELEGNMFRLVKLFMYCGIATIFWGLMFGSFFGDLIPAFSRTFLGKEATLNAIWFNPLEDPITLLIFSLILGVIHLFIGMGIKAYMQIKDGKIADAIFEEGFWYLTIPGLAVWLAGGSLGIDWLPNVGKWVTIVGMVGLAIGGARGKKGFGKITGAFSNIYSITSWMSDILSYARLLALGLATGVIAQVVNTMGTLFGGGVAGLILFILIFIVGTLLNFAINALGSFVHSARLQYVEFFGKFYIDGGEPFNPFRVKTKYIRIDDEIKEVK